MEEPQNSTTESTSIIPKQTSLVQVSGLELIDIQSITYTSLKDLLPQRSPSSPSLNSSWNEIPIKNPLVKQAALAYLQPMSSPVPEISDRSMLGRMWDECCRRRRRRRWWQQCECLAWVGEVFRGFLRLDFDGSESDEEDETGDCA